MCRSAGDSVRAAAGCLKFSIFSDRFLVLEKPFLVLEEWTQERPLEDLVSENVWRSENSL